MKHLNPRQGITTVERLNRRITLASSKRVKHLNPRQGITTSTAQIALGVRSNWCETPKSPPGDYNLSITFGAIALVRSIRVKHLNPRQGITTLHRARRILPTTRRRARVKHLNPRQGITTHLCTQHHPGHLCTQV